MVVTYLDLEIRDIYAILDIETTGGKYNEEGITEIAIYKYDGKNIVDQFISLVNPNRNIQPYVVNLTGISNKMLRSAPKFFEIAKRIEEGLRLMVQAISASPGIINDLMKMADKVRKNELGVDEFFDG